MLIRPILFRQPFKYEHNGFFHPTPDCVNVFPFQMVYSDTPPFSTFRVGEKIEDVLFEVKFHALDIHGALNGQRSSELSNICTKVSLQSSGRLA